MSMSESESLSDFDSQEEVEAISQEKCSYCSMTHQPSLVRCDGCHRWFCNETQGTLGSHIITHLVKSKHKAISLSTSSPIGDSEIACCQCQCTNVFQLGFVPSRVDRKVILLCRESCLHSFTRSEEWDIEKWRPLIEERKLIDWLAEEAPEGCPGMRQVTYRRVEGLEAAWRQCIDDSEPEEVIEPVHQEKLEPVPLAFSSPAHHRSIFSALLAREAEHDRLSKEALCMGGMAVRWEKLPSGRTRCLFQLSRELGDSIRLVPGDELELDAPEEGMLVTGNVSHITSTEDVVLEIPAGADVPSEPPSVCNISFVWKETSFKRMDKALVRFSRRQGGKASSPLTPVLRRLLLGSAADMRGEMEQLSKGHWRRDGEAHAKLSVIKRFEVPGLPRLNLSQRSAVKAALMRPLALIQGPPGTGKTVVSTAIVYHLVNANVSPVLVAAPSNVAADQLADKLHRARLRVVRLVAHSRESLPSPVESLALHKLVEMDPNPDARTLRDLRRRREDGGLTEKEHWRLNVIRSRLERSILKKAQVVVSTCISAGDQRLDSLRFSSVLVDEATQSAEPEVLIPLTLGAEHIVLVGDHMQLGPVIMCKPAANAGLNQSLFQRLVKLGLPPVRLEVQYRMHPALSRFPSDAFYSGQLQNGVSAAERRLAVPFPWAGDVDRPIMFIHCGGFEEISSSGTSYLNRAEAAMVCDVLGTFVEGGLNATQVGVITPYEGQRAFVVSHMQRSGKLTPTQLEAVEVASVDSFQGREKDIIVLSCVRANKTTGIGFLSDPRRLNVALTRAKYGIVLVGNASVLSRHPRWSPLLAMLAAQGKVVEGPLNDLRPITLKLSVCAPRDEEGAPRDEEEESLEDLEGLLNGGLEMLGDPLSQSDEAGF
eukprot:gnl/Dysnectes_brevis/4232_a5601_342.p1 GENE.gnl/Dysnectes_brevis/4232_a5601_342~~gnl/Dysnectes_brevis/4232_a5601_342.p1  ORF type:complete len:881 (+),score=408.29 gnl/Dysnectes_brevis/4232_a5601_342:57-2699(+)